VVQKCPNLFLSELCQISTKVNTFWHTDGQDDRIMYTHCTPHLIHYHVKSSCSKLLNNAELLCPLKFC